MSQYRPDQRIVRVTILNSRGWISGNIYVGKINLFLDAINAMPYLLKLADVTFQDGSKLPFFGIQRHAAELIIPEQQEDMIARKNPADTALKHVICMLSSGDVEGELYLPPDIRVSDFMAKKSGFFLLRRSAGASHHFNNTINSKNVFADSPPALVNASGVIGITESY